MTWPPIEAPRSPSRRTPSCTAAKSAGSELGEGAVEAHLHDPDFLTLGLEPFDRFVHDLGAGAHHDHDVLRVPRADVVEEVVAAAGDLREPGWRVRARATYGESVNLRQLELFASIRPDDLIVMDRLSHASIAAASGLCATSSTHWCRRSTIWKRPGGRAVMMMLLTLSASPSRAGR